jgi:hypothetical protein
MPIKLEIIAEDEIDLRRIICRLATPMLENFLETGGFNDPEPDAPEPPPTEPAASVAGAPKRGGRPKGSTNKPKTNGGEPQTETTQAQEPANGAAIDLLPLAEQIQIITDAAHDAPDKFKPLLVPLRDKLGVQYVSKAAEKDRPVLQEFINAHGLAV